MKTPYFAFYAKDWRSDPKVQQLTLEERGAYIHLLACMWDFQDDSCSLPYDDTFIARLLNIRPPKWKKLKLVLIEGAAPVLTVENDRIFNKRLRQEFDISTQKCLKNFTNAKKRWEKKDRDNDDKSLKNKETDDANALPTDCERNANGDKIKDLRLKIKDINQTHCPVAPKTGNEDDVGNVSPSDKKAEKKKTKEEKEISCRTEAKEIIDFLNQMANKHFRYSDPHLKLIMARLKSGVEAIDCRRVIITMVDTWKKNPSPKFANLDYATPDTLFNATKFEKYFSETKKRFSEFYHEE